MRILMLVGVLLLVQGCVIVPARRPGHPPPGRPVAMSYNEAVSLGSEFCRSRGYECRLKGAHKTGNDVWKVKFRAFAPGARGHVHLDYDAWSGALLKVDEKVKNRRGDWDDDDDWDDGRGRGRGKKEGHAPKDD